MAGSKTYLPSVVKIMDATRAGKTGQKTTRAAPRTNREVPKSMPNLRPRRSATEAANGLSVPTRLRAVRARDMVVRSTPNPRAKTARKG